ncbi:MAG: SDR family NAD(P)-dependent oxidoreductase [Egibacteraceae bacterium]
MAQFEFVALTLPGLADPSVAIAASRAGAIGVLDISFVGDEQLAVQGVARLARFARGRCGVRFDLCDEGMAYAVISSLPSTVLLAVLVPADRDVVRRWAELLRARGVELWLEATTLEEARLAVALGFDGVIAKGHEAGGRVGETTTFVLLQQLLTEIELPIWAQGGIGEHSAAACAAAGAAGVVLDAQLALTKECQLPDHAKAGIARMDGSETLCVEQWRLYARPGGNAAVGLRDLERTLDAVDTSGRPAGAGEEGRAAAWREGLARLVGWASPDDAWLLGQDAAFAARLAERFRTVGGVLAGLRQAVDEHLSATARLRPLAEGSPLARSHGTRYPIVQGPMTRVSDVPGFAEDVAEAGALPFLALAVMRGPQVEALLRQTQEGLGAQPGGGKPWGIGILGFVPLELREEQLEALRRYPPFFALIAGGRPDQALRLERAGIPTYLHVPSPGLLRLFAEAGARRFVLEGRECGGHVGPRTSFVLWDTMIGALLEAVPSGDLPDCHVLFAGGVHDARSAAMVAAMAAPLADRGVKVGVLLGTAYLFTEEAVAAGAITHEFQQEAIRCTDTVLLETGPGHATRCADTAFTNVFQHEQRRLVAEARPAEEIRARLEWLNLGRLRIAAKGIDRNPEHDGPAFVTLTPDEQAAQGMYMLGQVAALHGATMTLAELHHDVSVNSSALLEEMAQPVIPRTVSGAGQPCDIAIIGMSCLLPKAPALEAYWQNILDKVDAIVEIPKDRWDWRAYFDPDPSTPDKIYSRWGGFLDEIPFDPVRYGMPPNSLRSIEPLQLLTLEAVRAALDDAGYLDRPYARRQTGVVFGVGGAGDLANGYAVRAALPTVVGDAGPGQELLEALPTWTEDSFPGILLNVAAGRVANRFDLGGVNYTVDAACASSLAAVYLAVRELEAGAADMMLVGGADTTQTPFGYLCFSKTHALSPRGRCRPFDAGADGIVISEGLGVLVLKRLCDAERDGDRVYAVIKGVGASSDGRDKGLTAPRREGQMLALERAYARAGFSPATVGLVEAHGTGTVAGDQAEVEALTQVFHAAGALAQGCAIGSVKSMIGHTKGAAGVAGLIKAALGLHRKVLPPTLGVERPNPAAGSVDSPFYVNSEPLPWLRAPTAPPRRAGVSAFGFGGTNFHVAVEEYTDDYLPGASGAPVKAWPSELFSWTAASREGLRERVEALDHALSTAAVEHPLREVAAAVWAQDPSPRSPGPRARLAVVATSIEDLRSKLGRVRDVLATPDAEIWDRRGVYLTAKPLAGDGAIAFLYPGQGSQHPDMLRDLAIHFSQVREAFERADAVLADRFERPLSSYVFAPPGFGPDDEQARARGLRETNRAQPALGAAGMGLSRLLAILGVRPALAAGHSYGEYVALCGAGVIAEDVLYSLSEARGRCITEVAERDLGTMAAVSERPARIQEVLGSAPDVWVANLNAPRQTVISGTRSGIEQALERLASAGIGARVLPVACGFHSPLVAPARDRLAQALANVRFAAPRLRVYANTSAAPYPAEPARIADLLADHLVRPVRFAEQVEQMYAAGARLFVEVGPGAVLTGLVGHVLGARPHRAVSTQGSGQGSGHGLTALQHALAQLAAHGVDLDLDQLYEGRVTEQPRLEALSEDPAPQPETTWLVDGGSARPLHSATAAEERSTPARSAASGRSAAAARPIETAEACEGVIPRNGQHPAPAPPAAENGHSRTVLPRLALSATRPQTPAPGEGADAVALRFQQLMSKFLDVQQEVMTAYLQGSPNGSELASPVAPVAATSVADAEAAPQPTVLPESPAAEPPDADRITSELVRLVAERTGYPPEMLGLDVDLEADLGIDSIKRIEILGAAQQTVWPSDEPMMHEDRMEPLVKARTLRALVEAIMAMDATNRDDERRLQPEEPVGVAPGADAALSRLVATAVDAPIGETVFPLSGVVAITDDEQGVARTLAELLRARGLDVALIRDRQGRLEAGADGYAARLGDAEAARGLVEAIHERQGPISCLVHLLPLRAGPPFEELDVRAWQARLDLETRSLFHLAQATSADLRRRSLRTRLLAAVRLDGAFAFHGTGAPFQPSQGGVAGLVKTLAREWPEVACTVVDLGPDASIDVAERLAAELASYDGDGAVEVGWSGGRRIALRLVPAPLPESVAGQPLIDEDAVLLVTGGARGITASVTRELARRYRPRILVVGHSRLPDPDEAIDTAGITEPRALKAALAARLERDGSPAAPSQVEPAYRRLLADREIRANLLAMTEAGARVHYHQVDVRDAEQLTRLIDDAYVDYGRIDGVIHGAGIIEDKLIEDKASDSFDRVMDTKTVGAFALARALRPERLRFLVLFSSVSARLGNRGQGDYAAANEVLNKLAAWLDARWPGRVTSLLWGPWKTAGMVSDELERQLSRHGVQLIPPERGAAALIDELERGRKGDVEVVLGSGPWEATTAPPRVEGFPLLNGARVTSTPEATVLTRMLDPDRDHYLRDHQLDGHPVLPAAVAMELMAEAAAATRPGYEVAELRDLRLLKGVILDDGPRPVIVRTAAARPLEGGGIALDLTIADDRSGRIGYRAEVVLRPALPAAPRLPGRSLSTLEPFPMPLEQAYDELLFQGPLLRGITRIEGIDDEGLVATLAPSSPQRCLAACAAGSWIVDPVVIDSAFQLCILWARTRLDMTPLPARIRRFRRFAPFPDGPLRCDFRAQVRAGGHILDTQFAFTDREGRLLAIIEDMEAACSRSLNRLAIAVAGGDGR